MSNNNDTYDLSEVKEAIRLLERAEEKREEFKKRAAGWCRGLYEGNTELGIDANEIKRIKIEVESLELPQLLGRKFAEGIEEIERKTRKIESLAKDIQLDMKAEQNPREAMRKLESLLDL